jgi:hypothetical protein
MKRCHNQIGKVPPNGDASQVSQTLKALITYIDVNHWQTFSHKVVSSAPHHGQESNTPILYECIT